MKFLAKIKWFVTSDVEVRPAYGNYKGNEEILGFSFYWKDPFSSDYLHFDTYGLVHAERLLERVQRAREHKKEMAKITVTTTEGRIPFSIPKQSLAKAEMELTALVEVDRLRYQANF